ncbi:MAG: hypothetical protein WAZ77_15295 [Candidatus Nitrosopolaris sp.]|jgi:hypothetical protein
MNNTTLGICIALMAAALIVGGTLAYSSANAIMAVGKPGGTAGNGVNGGFVHTNGTGTNLNGANGNNANGVGATSVR